MLIRQIVPNSYWSDRSRTHCLLPQYNWDLRLNTSTLFDPDKLKAWYYQNIYDIYTYLGLASPQESLIDAFCSKENIKFE